ncbi:apolipoprotein N-acyltransferase [Actinobacillus seminis]|uniref:Apolipoprotein N-acyltransferase n=1 Tax=Actinobacillus seminis TaxID=722 RepID=A0A380VGD4_9PAST|nr:apolipoprotein N-acyltransferase [Actinobacillus seminis]SUU37746.1 apolipoprotein N-acyltransferase [Actinobacillus seminis]
MKTYLIALLSGGLGVFAFSPFDLWGVAYLSLLGLIWVVKTPQKKNALCGAFLWGLSFFSIGVSWLNVSINQFGGAPLAVSYLLVVLLAAYLALYPLLFAYLVRRFEVRSLALFPAIWTITEFLRGRVFTGFPWLQFGYTQIDTPFAGLGAIFGVEGLTFFVMWTSAVIFSLIAAIREKKMLIVAANVLTWIIIGGLSVYAGKLNFIQEQPERTLTITLAQGNIEQHLKWDPDYVYQTLDIYQHLIMQHLGKSDLIILPEAALPTLENHIQPYLQSLHQAAAQSQTEVLIGTVYQDPNSGKVLNSVIDLGNPAMPYQLDTTNRYNKHHLVPFGEYVPLESLLRPLGSVFNLPMSAFQSGAAVQPPLLAKFRHFTTAICYEIIFGNRLRQNLTDQTDFILTLSNDAWFGRSIGPWQHLQMARMRALELGKPVIRSTNTGISVFIDAKGKIIAQAPQFETTTLTQTVSPTTGKTPYAALGAKPLYFLVAFLILLRGFGWLLKRKMVKNT